MKKILILLIILNSSVFTQAGYEILIHNYTSHNNTIKVKIYPVSMIFNGLNDYNLLADKKNESAIWRYYYLNGVAWDPDEPNPLLRKKTYYTLNQGEEITLNADADVSGNDCHLGFGLGKYRVEVWWDNNILTEPPDESFTIEYDPGYYTCPRPPFSPDLGIDFFDNTSNPNIEDPRIEFAWSGNMGQFPLKVRDVGNKIEAWNQYQNGTREKEFGNFHYGNGTMQTPNNYTIIPQDPRRDCVKELYPQFDYNQNHLFNFAYNDPVSNFDYYGPANIGVLTLNLTIDKNSANGNPITISTPDYLTFVLGDNEDYPSIMPSPIVITNGATLKLAKGNNNNERILNLNEYENINDGTDLLINSYGTFLMESSQNNSNERNRVYVNSNCNAEVDADGWLSLGDYSIITLNDGSSMYWFPNSQISGSGAGEATSRIVIKTGAVLHNCGAVIYDPLNIIQDGGDYIIHDPQTCWTFDGPQDIIHTVDNGGSIEISNGGTLTIEKNCKLIFDGVGSHLKTSPGSTVKLGQGVSIEFRNGAYLDANGCTFTSINGSEIWEGLILDGAGSLTNIQNCTFNNAATSISVTNTVCNISGNTFNINSNSSCVYGINAVNESNITITGNTFNANSNSAAECIRFFNYDGDGVPGGGGSAYALNIYDNTFYGSLNAIDIQCLTASQLPFLYCI